ncbi:sensor histidine kinase [Arenimonas sp.]|uniref:sensor histidine kinase n=1 Tax=Arenimonas sp. TaxID=1872635 RepID=UPI002E332926|nr:ATP-binding protein [Arenimonas sp.]HEX4854083.1 ATP-binding protein [Arenimonas sp.]
MPLRASSIAAESGQASIALSGRRLEHALISVAEQEQERIGRELHDGLGQELAGAAFLAKALASKLGGINADAAADAEWIKVILGRCVEDVRTLSRQLSPTELEKGDVISTLDRLCADAERMYGLSCQLAIEPAARASSESASADAARQIFRICQEALNNATRHGACRTVRVTLALRGAHLRLAVSDDGRGFAVPPRRAEPGPGGIGLHSMRLRARHLGGRLRIARRKGWTHVVARFPQASVLAPSLFPPQPPMDSPP